MVANAPRFAKSMNIFFHERFLIYGILLLIMLLGVCMISTSCIAYMTCQAVAEDHACLI